MRACFEVPQILARLLRQSGPTVRDLQVLRLPARGASDPRFPQEALQ